MVYKDWFSSRPNADASLYKLGEKFAALQNLFKHHSHLMTEEAMGLPVNYGGPLLRENSIPVLLHRAYSLTTMALFIIARCQLVKSSEFIDTQFRAMALQKSYEFDAYSDYLNLYRRSNEPESVLEKLFLKRVEIITEKFYSRSSSSQSEDLARQIKLNPKSSIRIIFDFMMDATSQLRAFAYKGTLCAGDRDLTDEVSSFTFTVEELAVVGNYIDVLIYRDIHTDISELLCIRECHLDAYTPQNGPVSPEEMLWLIDAYSYKHSEYKNLATQNDPKLAKAVLAFMNLRRLVSEMIGDVADVESIQEWKFDPSDQEVNEYVDQNDLFADNFIGFARGFHGNYRDKLSEQKSIQFEEAIKAYFYAYHNTLAPNDYTSDGAEFFSRNIIDDPHSIIKLSWNEYCTPDVSEILGRAEMRANNRGRLREYKEIEEMALNPPAGMAAFVTAYIPYDKDAVLARRKIFERGSRTRNIPEQRRDFVRSVAQAFEAELRSYFNQFSDVDSECVIALMIERGTLPSKKNGKPFLSIDHVHDLSGGGLNMRENFLLVSHAINAAKNRLIELQRGLISNPNEPYYCVSWKPQNPLAKLVL